MICLYFLTFHLQPSQSAQLALESRRLTTRYQQFMSAQLCKKAKKPFTH